MSTNTKACPVCGKVISVNSKGAMAKHQKTKTCQKYKEQVQDKGDRVQDKGDRVQDKGDRVQDKGDRVQDKGDRVQDKGDRVQALPIKVEFDSLRNWKNPHSPDCDCTDERLDNYDLWFEEGSKHFGKCLYQAVDELRKPLTWSTIESDNSTQYKDITNYDDIISDLRATSFAHRRSLAESRLQIQNIHQHYQLQIELLRRPFPTCETVNSECQTVAFPTCETECQTETDAVLSECDTVSVKSEGEEIAPRIMKTPPVRKAFGEQLSASEARSSKLEVTSIETSDLNIQEYSAKSFVVRGNTKEYKDKLKSLGGKWNPNLTDKETGSRFGGWIFGNNKRKLVEEYIENQQQAI
jgi:hypothetical protein